MTYRSSYELELNVGFALLEQIEESGRTRRYRYTPEEGAFEEIFLAGVYGGLVDPDSSHEFFVYTLEWPDELHDERDDELLEVLSSELDSLFPGWVFDQDEQKVYILRDPETPPPSM